MLIAKKITFIEKESILLNEISLVLNYGDVIRIEGNNGAGKTTLLKIITGMIHPDSGDISWENISIFKLKEDYHSKIIYLGHKLALKGDLTVSENLQFYSLLARGNKSNITFEPIIDQLNLGNYSDVLVRNLSEGQKRRVALARLWHSDAKLWILDEPFTAIDYELKQQLIKLFDSHIKNGGMILYTSHHDVINNSIILKLNEESINAVYQNGESI